MIGFANAIETPAPENMVSKVQTISKLPSPSATTLAMNVANNICNNCGGITTVYTSNNNCSSRVNTKQQQCLGEKAENSQLLPAGNRQVSLGRRRRRSLHEDGVAGGAGSLVSAKKNWLHEGLGQSDYFISRRGYDVVQGGLAPNNCNKVVRLFDQTATTTTRETGDCCCEHHQQSGGKPVSEVAHKLDAILSAAATSDCVRERLRVKGDAAPDCIANWGFVRGYSKNNSDDGTGEESDDKIKIVGGVVDGRQWWCHGGSQTSSTERVDAAGVVLFNDDNKSVGELLDGDNYGRINHHSKGAGDCDCGACLGHELFRMEREILLMFKQKQTTEQQVVVENPQPSKAVAGKPKPHLDFIETGQQRLTSTAASRSQSWRQLLEPATALGCAGSSAAPSQTRKYLCVSKAGPSVIVGGAEFIVEEEFGEASTELEPFVMVTSGAAYRGFADKPTDKYKMTSGVEGQLSALLTSGTKELPWKQHGQRPEEKGLIERRECAGGAKRQTNLIENQLLTLEEQFWRREDFQANKKSDGRAGSITTTTNAATVQTVMETNEATPLLLDPSQEHLISESTPVKKVSTTMTTGGGTSLAVIVDEAGPRVLAASTTPTPSPNNFSRRKRFEQFLKSLVGKKAVAAAGEANMLRDPDATDGGTGQQASLKVPMVVDSMIAANKFEDEDEQRPRDEDRHIPTRSRYSFGSMSSLNSAVQQKFLNILPSSSALLSAKRNMSVNNLSAISERSRAELGRTRKSNPSHHRMMTVAPRGLKAVSCSFSNLEHLKDLKVKHGGSENGRNGGSMAGEGDSGNKWPLKVSKSTNHLQSTICGSGEAEYGNGNGPARALNRFRNSLLESVSQVNIKEQCSRCSSILSLAAGTMVKVRCSDSSVESTEDDPGVRRYSCGSGVVLEEPVARRSKVVIVTAAPTPDVVEKTNPIQSCKLCLGEVSPKQMTKIGQCRCAFCSDCMKAYIEFEILEGAYEISCPDAMCPAQGVISMDEIAELTTPDLVTKHNRYRLNREVEMDKNRTWCPKAGCDTVCLMDSSNQPSSSSSAGPATITVMPSSSSSKTVLIVNSVRCPTCSEEFCSACKKTWHPRMSCEENIKRLAADGNSDNIGIPFDNDLIKCCPMCGVPIEKDEGCAQMMCKRCKHVFCWYCLASLDDDFLLRHYDKGPCKNKLGHSRASVVWHRAQVIGIFAGFGLLLLVASPLLLLAAPCIVCCKCRICSGGTKIEEEPEIEFDPLTMP